MRNLLAVAVVMWPCYASAIDTGQYEGVDPKVRAWFKSVHSPNGVPCCDISDGHITTWFKKPDNSHYWVNIEGVEREVPDEAIIRDASHPEGETVVWYVKQGGGNVHIRCFVAGRGV